MSTRTRQHPAGGGRGFTLIEMIVFVVIASTALAGILSIFMATEKSSADPIAPKQAMLIAESMLEEILLKQYANPPGGYVVNCPTVACERARYDDVSDYAGYASKGVYALDDLANKVPGLDNYNVAVSVGAASVTAAGNGAAGLRITVTVSNGTVSQTLSGYRFNYD